MQRLSTRCITCGAELHGRSICRSCGSLVGLETAITHVGRQVVRHVSTVRALAPTRLTLHHLLWVCASIPLLVGPALVSLCLSVLWMRSTRTRSYPNDLEWIATVAMLNLLLSGIILYRYQVSLTDFFAFLLHALRSWHLLPFPPMPAETPSLTPV
jgi:hypothetical protein